MFGLLKRQKPMVSESRRRKLPRSVGNRVFLAFSVVAVAFVGVAGWGVVALRAAAEQANLVRNGYLPLTRALRDLVTLQDTWNAQLNHITTARNPTDARVWFEAALHIGRPKKFSEVRAAITLAFVRSADPTIHAIGRDLLAEVKWVERTLESEPDLLKQLFDAMSANNAQRAERVRDSLLKRGLSMHGRLSRLDRRVLANVDALSVESSEHEQFAVRLLIGLSILTALIGGAMALYVQRVLRPLGMVTRRARDVAEGDWTERPVVSTGDEIGELASAFETMVRAIAGMREQMLSADRLATIGKMAAHVTHEIRNPLSSMALNVELLEDELPDDAKEARAILASVQRELTRLTALTEQYLSIARHRKAKVEPEDLRVIVREAVEFIQRDLARRKIYIALNLPESAVILALDEMQLRQALFNLIRNADEAMPDGGTVTITLSELTQERVSSHAGGDDASVTNEWVQLTFEDEGPGIEPEMAPKIFDPFVTTKQTGTGLGLAVTRQIVESHGGRIRCESVAGQGARFVIEFPKPKGAILPQQ
jgi:signal transduction histidine kinase